MDERGQPDAATVRLVADAMLGRLARWLRALGYDTVYDVHLDDSSLARLARAERRLLLTRDRQLTARRGLRAMLVASDRLEEQLSQVLAALPPPSRLAFGRCVVCNSTLDEVDRRSAESRVPEYIWETHDEFTLCRGCGRVYWRGSHHDRVSAVLERLTARRSDSA